LLKETENKRNNCPYSRYPDRDTKPGPPKHEAKPLGPDIWYLSKSLRYTGRVVLVEEHETNIELWCGNLFERGNLNARVADGMYPVAVT
jgi:hypothetical protein